MRLERLPSEFAEASVVERRSRRADDFQVIGKQPVRIERVKRGQQHPPGKIAGGAEHQKCGNLGAINSRYRRPPRGANAHQR